MAQPTSGHSIATLGGGKVAAAVMAYDGVIKLYNQSRAYWNEHFAYTVTVSEKDPLYSDVHSWLLTVMPDDKHRTLLISSSDSRYSDMAEDESTPRKNKPLTVRFDDSVSRQVDISGHSVRVQLYKPESGSSSTAYEPEPKRIEFTTATHSGQRAVIEQLELINSRRATERKATLKMVTSWGSWRTRSDLPPRSLASVSIPEDQKNRIVSDIENFLAAEDRYNRLAIPWHRGYMFHGPPGTGKTSIVKALANHFCLDLWYVGLSDLKAESGLMSLLSEVGPRSILLLEDIDTIKITHDRDASEQGVISMSSLLNSLDGVATPHGLITMMTTNRFDILDPALTRAGRMDMVEKLDYPTKSTLAQMYLHFFDIAPRWEAGDTPIEGLSTAKVAELFKQNLSNPLAAEQAIFDILRPRD